jgi:hypothetical protein
MKRLLLLLSFFSVHLMCPAQQDRDLPAYQYDTLIYRHQATVRPLQALVLPPNAYVTSVQIVGKTQKQTSVEIRYSDSSWDRYYNPREILCSVAERYLRYVPGKRVPPGGVGVYEDGRMVALPAKLGAEGWTAKPVNWIEARGLVLRVEYFTLQ